jgi:hypothetical protein
VGPLLIATAARAEFHLGSNGPWVEEQISLHDRGEGELVMAGIRARARASLPCVVTGTFADGVPYRWSLATDPAPTAGDESFEMRLTLTSAGGSHETRLAAIRRGDVIALVMASDDDSGPAGDVPLIDTFARRAAERLGPLVP